MMEALVYNGRARTFPASPTGEPMPDFSRHPKKIQAPKVMIIDFRPAAVPESWAKTEDLAREYVSKMIHASDNTLAYQLVIRKTVRDYPLLTDGRRYTDQTWAAALQDDRLAFRDMHGGYLMADYVRIVQDLAILALIRDQIIDEVWMFGGPYFGFYESRMVGQGAFWCNAPGLEQPGRLFVMMGFNYQRNVKEMFHDFGHRAESILARQYNSVNFLNQLYNQQPTPAPANDFEHFLIQNGTTHRPPGGADYSQDEIAWVTKLKPEWWIPAVDPNQAR
jgi:hypothetical protein